MSISSEDIAQLAANIQATFSPDVINKALGIVPYTRYASDPIGFGEQILGDTYTDEVKALMESVRDNPITIAKSANAVGKTHGAARVAVWWYKAFADSQVYTAAAPPESNLKKLLWGEIGSITEKHPNVFESDTKTTLHVQRNAQSFISGVTIPSSGTVAQREAKFSGKHAPYLLFILDEGDAVPDEVYKGIESCMSGGVARLLVMFNPRAEMGEAYRMERDGRANIVALSAFNHPNVVSGEDEIPGAVTRETTVRRINEWCRSLVDGEVADSECFDLPPYLVGAIAKSHSGKPYAPLRAGQYKIMEPSFAYMVLGRYPAQGSNQLISNEWLAKARSRWDAYVAENGEVAPRGVLGRMGLDVAEMGDDLNAACFRYGGWVERLIMWGNVDPIVTGERAAAHYDERSLVDVSVDATGVGAGVAPHMRRLKNCNAHSVKVASRPTKETELGEFRIMRDQLWWACREWLRTDPGAMLPPDDRLLEELKTPTYEVRNGKIEVMRTDVIREILLRSPDKATALCMTFADHDTMFDPLDLSKCVAH